MTRWIEIWGEVPPELRWRGRLVATALFVGGLLVLSMVPGHPG